jgi:uncharacterized membrane protein YdjX (TVP38/TMEM64 family)
MSDLEAPKRRLHLAGLAALAVVVLFFLTVGREPLNHFLDRLRQWGPVPFYAVFAVLVSFGVPPTPFLLAAGAAFDLPTNLLALPLAYGASLGLSFPLASRLFRRQLGAFLAAKAPVVAGLLKESPALSIILVRCTPGFPYVLQNCLLVSTGQRFATFFLVSLPPLLLFGLIYLAIGKSLLAGKYGLLGVVVFLLFSVLLVFRLLARRRAARGGIGT